MDKLQPLIYTGLGRNAGGRLVLNVGSLTWKNVLEV